MKEKWLLLRRFAERLTRAQPEQEKASSSEGHWSDQEILTEDQDRFSFQDYANVLAGRAATADTPLTIGIFGRWGSGKTSLMRLIEAALPKETKKDGRLHGIWINVWQLSNQDEVWHAFLQALFSKVHGELSLWRRIDKCKLLRQLASNSYRIVLVITPMIVGLLIVRPEAGWGDVLSLVLNPIAGGGTLLTVGLGLWTLAKPIIEAARETVKFDLQAVLKYAPYEAQVTELMQLRKRFRDMVEVLVGEDGRLVVFIDDLDRCTPDKVPEVLEAIKLFTTTPRCVYVLGLEHDIVRQGIKAKYEFEEAAATEYLEKIVQIPFHLPPLDESRIESFIQEYYPDLHEVCPTAPDVFSQGLEPNPRKVKRALNIYRTLLDLADVRVRAWEMDPVEPELVAKMVVIQSRFRPLHEYLVRHPTFLLTVEAKALADGLDDESLAGDEEVGWVLIGKPDQRSTQAKPGLIEVTGLRALDDMLRTGERHFNDDDQRDQISTYIYLIATTEGAAEQVRPNRREREALLDGDRAQIKAQVDEILKRGVDEPARQRIGQAYIERLEGVLIDPDRYTPAEAESASIALSLLEVSLFGETWDSIQARLDELLYTEPAEAQVAVRSMDQQTMLADETPLVREESQEAKQRLRRRLQLVLDGSGFYDTTQVLTANMALDLLEEWERKDFEPQTVRVPAGPFLMGSSAEQVRQAIANGLPRDVARAEQPQHSAELGMYRIGRYPVTNAEYQAFVQETGHEPPEHWDGESYPEGKDDHPVVSVTWHDAVAYCQWLSQKTEKPYRLPSEAEWEKGARGNDGRIYPWGNQWDAKRCNSEEGGKGDTTPVGAYPQGVSPYGLLDMAGNVWGWTLSVYKGYPYDPEDGREDLEAEGLRVLRGGAFRYSRRLGRCASRVGIDPYRRYWHYGFRVVVSPGSPLASENSGL